MRESGGQLRGDKAGDEAGGLGLDRRLLDEDRATGQELRPGARFVQPDGNDPADETVLAVPLPSPVAPHGEIALDIAFRAKLPKIFARTGFVRDYFLVGQWYPKIGVYEPAGMRERKAGGWNCHAFHANSEFYADYGDFDVSMTVPSQLRRRRDGQARRRRRRPATRRPTGTSRTNVHDFAWTADPRFLVTEFPFDPARDVPGRLERAGRRRARHDGGRDRAQARRVSDSCFSRATRRARERYIRSTKEALSFYGLWYGAYPVRDADGRGSAGRRPGLGRHGVPDLHHGRRRSAPSSCAGRFDRVRVIEIVTIHEFGHQYWYGMVGSNEFEESWLDEGLNDDSEYRAMALAYGPRDVAEFPGGIGFDSLAFAHGDYTGLPNLDPIRRVRLVLRLGRLLRRQLLPRRSASSWRSSRTTSGAQVFARAQRAYFQEWSFRHPTTSDFFDTFERVSGRDLSTYRRNLVDGTARLDWQVVTAQDATRPIADDGVFDRAGGRVTLEDGAGRAARKEKAPARAGKDDQKVYETVVLFGNTASGRTARRRGIVFEDGTILDRELPDGGEVGALPTSATSRSSPGRSWTRTARTPGTGTT